jgi:hypothetical protein
MIESMDDYFAFRQRVLASATGADIHEVNGLLGRIMNWTHLASKPREPEVMAEYRANIEGAVRELRVLLPNGRF